MALGLQPSQFLVAHLQVAQHEGRLVFHFTAAAQARLEDLLSRRKDTGLTTTEHDELDALAELDRIFTYINAQLVSAQGRVPTV